MRCESEGKGDKEQVESAEELRYGVSAAIVNWGPESGQATCAAGRQIPRTRTRPTSVWMKGWISNMSDMNCRLHLIGLRWLTLHSSVTRPATPLRVQYSATWEAREI